MRNGVNRDLGRPLWWGGSVGWPCPAWRGRIGRGASGKTPFLAAVETSDRGRPQRMKLTVVKGFRCVELAAWARRHLCEGSRAPSDGLACPHAVADAGCSHDAVVTGADQCAASRFHRVEMRGVPCSRSTSIPGSFQLRPRRARSLGPIPDRRPADRFRRRCTGFPRALKSVPSTAALPVPPHVSRRAGSMAPDPVADGPDSS